MKDLDVGIFRRASIVIVAFIVVFSGLTIPAQADQITDLQNNVIGMTTSFDNLNAILQSNIRDGEKDVAALDGLNKKIIANQDQMSGAIISVPLDNNLQAQKKELETVILNRSNQNNSIIAKMKSITLAIDKTQQKIKILQNGGTLVCDYMIDDASCQPTNKLQQTINYAYAGDEKLILSMTTVPVDMIKANASSGLPVSRSVTKGSDSICTILGNTLTFNSEGNCNITISQYGNEKYDAAELQISLIVQKNPKLSETSACSSQAGVIENSYARTYEALQVFDSNFGSSDSAAKVFVSKGMKTVDEANSYFNSGFLHVQSVFTAAATELKSGKLEPPCLLTGAGKEIYNRVMSGYNTLADVVNSQITSGRSNSLTAIKTLGLIGTSGGNQAACDYVVNDFISSATGQLQYMDYITSQWSDLKLLLEYATQNRVTTWNQMIDIFKGKIEYANQNMVTLQNNFKSGKLEASCNGTETGDALIMKVGDYLRNGAILNQALARMDQTISTGFSKFSSVPLNSSVATCSSKSSYYSSSLDAVVAELSAFNAKIKAMGIPNVKLTNDSLNSYLNYSVNLDSKLQGISNSTIADSTKYPDCPELIKIHKSTQDYLSISKAMQYSIKSSTDGNQSTSLDEDPNDPTLDGEEEAPYAEMKPKRSTTGTYTISVSSNLEDEDLVIKASKKGSKTIVYKVHTKDDGNYSFKTTRNLKGFKLTLYYFGDVLSTLQL